MNVTVDIVAYRSRETREVVCPWCVRGKSISHRVGQGEWITQYRHNVEGPDDLICECGRAIYLGEWYTRDLEIATATPGPDWGAGLRAGLIVFLALTVTLGGLALFLFLPIKVAIIIVCVAVFIGFPLYVAYSVAHDDD